MERTAVTAIQVIQAMLAPAVGMSAVGLLLLGLSSRYSSIVNRIRLLNDEKRRYSRQLVDQGTLGYTDNTRYMSIAKQTEELLARSRIVRNAILLMQSSIGLFVLTSAAIAMNLFANARAVETIAVVVFIIGMLAVLAGVVCGAVEIYRSYRIVLLEVRGE